MVTFRGYCKGKFLLGRFSLTCHTDIELKYLVMTVLNFLMDYYRIRKKHLIQMKFDTVIVYMVVKCSKLK